MLTTDAGHLTDAVRVVVQYRQGIVPKGVIDTFGQPFANTTEQSGGEISNDPLLAWVDDFLIGLHHKLKPVFGILLPSAGYIHFHPLHDGQVVAYNGNTVQLVSLAVQHSLTGRIERHGVAAVLGVLNTLGVD